MKDIKYYAELSIGLKESVSLDCNLILEVNDQKFHAYEVSVATGDLLFFCDEGTANYVVDTYEDRITGKTEVLAIELFNWESDNETV
jgi:hypothetical protein